jgi:hypothetical protein
MTKVEKALRRLTDVVDRIRRAERAGEGKTVLLPIAIAWRDATDNLIAVVRAEQQQKLYEANVRWFDEAQENKRLREWTHQVPTKPGLYLRNNPPINAIVKCFIVSIDGVMNMADGSGSLVRVDDRYARWWWHGPIPYPKGVSFIEEYTTPP